MKNNLNLLRSTFHKGPKILNNFSYHVVTYPAASEGIPALRIRSCKAWLALSDKERLNIAYSDKTNFRPRRQLQQGPHAEVHRP